MGDELWMMNYDSMSFCFKHVTHDSILYFAFHILTFAI